MIDPGSGRVTCAINLELAHGRHGASARVEIGDEAGIAVARLAVLGWIDRVAFGRLDRTLDELRARGVRRFTLDASRLRHVDHAVLPGLLASIERFDSASGACTVEGLSRHLVDLFRLAGWNPQAPAGDSAVAMDSAHLGTGREWAS